MGENNKKTTNVKDTGYERDFIMEEKIEVLIDVEKLKQQATIYLIAIAVVSVALYYSIWGFTWNLSTIAFLKFSLLNFIGLILHEMIHGIAFIIIGKAKISDVKFGVIWKNLTPYAHCKVPLSMRAYKISILLPVIITGFIPLIIGLCINSLLIVLVSVFLIAGGLGDWFMYRKLRPFANNTVVIDHPSEIGCIVETKGTEASLVK